MSDNNTIATAVQPATPQRASSQHSTLDPSPIAATTTSKEPVALATTKRKFQKLLDSITGNAPRPKASPKDPHETAAKRIRLEARSRLETSNGIRGDTNNTFIQTQLLASRLTAAKNSDRTSIDGSPRGSVTSNGAIKESNYVPWSHDAFLRRLKTFADVRLWTPKPEDIGDAEWAKRGWICVAWNTVGCKGGCEQRIVVGLRPSRKDKEGKDVEDTEDFSVEIGMELCWLTSFGVDRSTDKELVRRYVELVKTGHDESCLWRNAGCKDDIFRLPIAKPSIWQTQLRERYNSLAAISDQLPSFQRLVLPFDAAKVSSQIQPSFFANKIPEPKTATISPPEPFSSTPTNSSQEINTTALSFALLGWTGSNDPALATCSACFRRIGLWLYIDTVTSEIPVSNATPLLDLVGNHRDYCPWINSASQQMPGSFAGLAAWEILLRLIANDAPSSRPGTAVAASSDDSGTRQDRLGTPSIRHVSDDTIRPSTDTVITSAVEENEAAQQILIPKKKDPKDVEKEDKARFTRLKELTKLMGLRGRTTKTK